MIESVLLTAAHILTYNDKHLLTAATGFFFERDAALYLVTSRHVLIDPPDQHFPDRIEITVHNNPDNATESIGFSIPLYRDRRAVWRQCKDSGGEVDVAVLKLDRHALPEDTLMRAFTPAHLSSPTDRIEVGTSLLVIGFPLGFYDTLHHVPVARQAMVASSFGLRFQGKGYFLTDARTHRGSSGAPVVMRSPESSGDLPWVLLGVHSSRLDIGSRDREADEALGLNCAWYSDILMALTDDPAPTASNAK